MARAEAIVHIAGLNIHHEPGSERINDAVPKGTVLEVMYYVPRKGHKKQWLYVYVPSRRSYGYVDEEFITYLTPADPPPVPPRPDVPPAPKPLPVSGLAYWVFGFLLLIGVILAALMR